MKFIQHSIVKAPVPNAKSALSGTVNLSPVPSNDIADDPIFGPMIFASPFATTV